MLELTEGMKAVGFPAFALLLVAIGLYWSVRWLGKEIVKPFTDRHLRLVDHVQENSERNADTLDKIAETQRQLADKIDTASCKLPDGCPVATQQKVRTT